MAGRIAYLGNIATQGLVLNLDAAIKGSYPGTGTTWTDVSNNGNNGTLTNGPTFSSVDYGSIVFDGTNDYVDTPYTTPIGLGGFSYSTWVNFTSSQIGGIVVKRIGSPTFEQLSLSVAGDSNGNTTGSKFIFNDVQNISNLRLGITSGSYNDGRWHNVTLTRTSTTTTMYVEGAPTVTITSAPLNLSTATKLFVGRSGDNQTIGGIPFSGSIALAQVYNQSLTQFQVWQNFNAYKSRYGIPDIVTDGLVLNLDAGNPYSYLSGSSGTSWANTVVVSSSLSGSLLNGARYSNGAMVFDGVDDECNLGNILFNSASATTIDMWVNIPSMAVNRYITGKGSAGDGIYTFICITGPGPSGGGSSYIRFAMGNQSGSTSTNIEYSNLNWNQWYNFTFTYDGSFVRGYQNAVLPTSSSLSGNLYTTTSPIQLASSKYGSQAACIISNYKIYNRALSQAEITQNFNALRGRYGI
jgi:hypothetical protein